MKNLALRLYREKGILSTVITNRTGLKVNGATGEVDNDLSYYNGKTFVLFDIDAQKEIGTGTVENGELVFDNIETP